MENIVVLYDYWTEHIHLATCFMLSYYQHLRQNTETPIYWIWKNKFDPKMDSVYIFVFGKEKQQ